MAAQLQSPTLPERYLVLEAPAEAISCSKCLWQSGSVHWLHKLQIGAVVAHTAWNDVVEMQTCKAYVAICNPSMCLWTNCVQRMVRNSDHVMI